MGYIEAASTIEIMVAAGLGLDVSHLKVIYDRSVDERRGFWRYFTANPYALDIVDAAKFSALT